MNFLSHYYFDRHTDNPYEVLGMLLPDLVKNADKNWSLHPEKNRKRFLVNSNQLSLLNGWSRHLEVDRIFHGSAFFLHHQHQIKLLLKKELAHSPVKPFFLGHISLELLLDSILIADNLVSIKKLYEHLERISENEIILFLNLNNVADPDKFIRFYNKFLEAKYLYSYSEDHKITYALKRICMRLWPNPFDEVQETAITKRLNTYKKKLREDFIIIFDQIDAQLN